jgi:hypothetical protein
VKRALLVTSLLAAAAVTVALAAPPRVSITRAERHVDVTGAIGVVLDGVIAGRAAAETVGVLRKECGADRFFHLEGGTQTSAGGRWHFEVRFVASGAYFRARWRRALSRPVLVRAPVEPQLEVTGRTVVVRLFSEPPLSTRLVQLQRRNTVGQWVAYKRARLRSVGRDQYEARFRISLTPGLTLRGFLPAASARPCLLPAGSEPWTYSTEARVSAKATVGGPAGPRQVVLTGTIPSRAAGEQIDIETRGCGPAGRVRQVADSAATTSPGGAWRWYDTEARRDRPTYFRARWQSYASDPVLVRTPLHVALRRSARGVRVVVTTRETHQRMAGRIVELQRKAGSEWVRARRATLGRVQDHRYEATFRVRRHGLTLRAFVPAGSAAPCYLATASKSHRS